MLISFKSVLTAGLLFTIALILPGCDDSKSATALKIEDQVIAESANSQVQETVAQLLQAKKDEVSKLSKLLAVNFPIGLTLDTSLTNSVNSVTVPTLMHGNQSLHFDHAIPDRFTAQTGAVATLFARSNDEFVRVSTSLKREDGGRAFGTTLNHKHPAYLAALAGNTYTGTATLFGIIYMTEYTPIKDAASNVVAIQFVGIDISNDIIDLKAKLR